ncbi:MAG: hypothetical protein QW048_07070 [Nitrososphaerota archaeon]
MLQLQLNFELAPINGILLILLGLLLTFLGRKFIKIIVFILGGLLGAFLTYQFILPRLSLGEPMNIILPIIAFVGFGLLSLLLMGIVVGFIAGYSVYTFSLSYFENWIYSLILAVIVFIIIAAFFNKILSIVTAVTGGLVTATGIQMIIPLNSFLYLVIVVVLSVLGAYYQLKH